MENKAFRERQHPSTPRSVNESPIHWAKGWKLLRVSHWPITWLIYLPCTVAKVNPIVHPTWYLTHIPFIPSKSTLPFLSYSNFNILLSKSKVKVMGEVKVWSHNVTLTFYQLTSLSFHVNRPSHSWDMTFSKFDLENPRSRSWKRWTLKVTTWVQHSIDSHPFHSMSIGHPIHKIRLFQNLTLKIQGQGQSWGQSRKSQSGCNILWTHIPFVPCQSAIPFLRYDFFKIWPWKSKVKVMEEVNIESHNMGPTFYQLTSLSVHANRSSHS